MNCAAWGVLPYSIVKLCIFVGINVGGYFGWELSEHFGTMTAFVLSGAGSVVGVFAGWWVARRLLP
jgi:hypothetical protein